MANGSDELVKDGRRIKQSNPPDWTGRNRRRGEVFGKMLRLY